MFPWSILSRTLDWQASTLLPSDQVSTGCIQRIIGAFATWSTLINCTYGVFSSVVYMQPSICCSCNSPVGVLPGSVARSWFQNLNQRLLLGFTIVSCFAGSTLSLRIAKRILQTDFLLLPTLNRIIIRSRSTVIEILSRAFHIISRRRSTDARFPLVIISISSHYAQAVRGKPEYGGSSALSASGYLDLWQ